MVLRGRQKPHVQPNQNFNQNAQNAAMKGSQQMATNTLKHTLIRWHE